MIGVVVGHEAALWGRQSRGACFREEVAFELSHRG